MFGPAARSITTTTRRVTMPFVATTNGAFPMLKCTILDDYQKIATSMANWSLLLPQVEVQSLHYHFTRESELVEAIKDQDILVIMRERTIFNASLLAQLTNLKLLVTSGMRNAAIDLGAAAKYGITVCGTQSMSEPAVEHTWALILGLARNIAKESLSLQTGGPWQSSIGVGLHGKRLGIIGLGKIGSKVAQIAKAFGMEVIAWSQNLTKTQADVAGVSLASSKEALLENSDFVSIHLVLSERTKNLLRAVDIAKMRPSAYLINTSRAPIVNETDLVQALRCGRIAGAGLDVFDIEPLPKDHPFRTLSNILATPHIGYVTRENYKIYFEEAVEDIMAFLKKAPIRELTISQRSAELQSRL